MFRPVQMRFLRLAAVLVGCAALSSAALSQTSFSAQTIRNMPADDNLVLVGHGDFNSDGREDLVVRETQNYGGGGAADDGLLFLSNGDGTYDAPASFPVAPYAATFTIGDFNRDGKLDFAVPDVIGSQVRIYLGNGDGTFQSPRILADSNAASESVQSIRAVDLNHDGKTDLVEVVTLNSTTILQIWTSNGDGTFTVGQRISSGVVGATLGTAIGDFDGDGKPDLAILSDLYGPGQGPTTVQVWYGDGQGNLGSPYQVADPNTYNERFELEAYPVGDVNNDGKSDLIAARSYPSSTGLQFVPQIGIFLGNGNRTLTFESISTSQCPQSIAVADFTGDGLNDLAYAESPCNDNGNGPYSFVVAPGTSSGFGAEQTIHQNAYSAGTDLQPVKSTRGTKPDLAFTQWTQASTSPASVPPQAVMLLSNSSAGSFPGCGSPSTAEGLNVCTPAATSTSPVKFSIGAAGPTPMRTVAVWADGQKVAEELAHAFSNYSFLDASVPLAPGSHSIAIFGTGIDNTLQEQQFTLTVQGSSCAAPSSPGLNVCSLGNGSTVTSPVDFSAAANITGSLARMEIWMDGVKEYTETTSTSFNTSLSLPQGYHRFDFYAVNTAGTKWEQTVYATVSGGNCPTPSSPGVNICNPISSSTVSSPVLVTAAANITGTLARMEIWVDGVKKYTETTSNSFNTSIPLGSGNHEFDVYAVNTAGSKWESIVYATVP